MNIMKGKKIDNRGSAMIVSLVIGTVVMVFCLSLLLVSYSLYTSTVKNAKYEQCKQITESYSRYLDASLVAPAYSDIEDMYTDLNNSKNNIWFYLRYNLLQDNWPLYVFDESTDEDEKKAYRYFKVVPSNDGNGFSKYASNISTCMYLVKDEVDEDIEDKEKNYYLHVIVECDLGDVSYRVENIYNLNIMELELEENPSEDYSQKCSAVEVGNALVNPSNNHITVSERWMITFDERK